jgi:Holliday junction DNA helicase RuvA
MIYSLEGKILKVENDFIVLNVCGIGYKVFTGYFSLELKSNQDLFLYTYQVVRENALDLFGFKTESELQLFELLISISGIGPKVALAIMGVTTPQSLKRAVISQNLEELTKVSGIGKKNAQKILIELSGKIDKIKITSPTDGQDFDLEVYETLEALGFERNKIRNSLKDLSGENTGEKIKQALKILGRK